ncbi:MAG: hypothetical protein BGO32_03540 [Bacteroidetes bacterium 37-13]|nr:MAG: hypothetical protein BGO32_03540 [Bacteroidetes bacterium 37-13]
MVFDSLFPSFLNVKYKKPSDYISTYWEAFQKHPEGNNNLNGKIFEYILATLCVRENILPLYMSAKVAFVPNVIYDLMFYTAERGPICISAKTSLRERYKQADLEAIALKYVHRKALSFLVTLEENEAKSVKAKIKSGDVIGLDNVVVATNNEFNELIEELKSYKFSEPPTVKVIESNQIITFEKVKALK